MGSKILREAVVRPHMGKHSPQRLDRAVTLALTLGQGAVHGDSSTYSHGKGKPTWARIISFLVPERVVLLPYALQRAHSSQ